MKNDFMSKVKKLRGKIDKNQEKARNIEINMEKVHAEAVIPRPLMIDEVALAFVSFLRVAAWQTLGEDFGGYKHGRLFAYIMSVLNEKIEESTAATIKVDLPLYAQCPIVNTSDFRVATTEELLEKSKEILDIIAEKLKESDEEDEECQK